MTGIVLDSGILIASMLPDEPLSSQAEALIAASRAEGISAPQLFRSEVTAVLRKAVYAKRITDNEGLILLQRAFAAPITYYEDDELLTEAYRIANTYQQPRTYDAQYLALAQRLKCPFWTTDEKLFNAFHAHFEWIAWLGHFSESQPE